MKMILDFDKPNQVKITTDDCDGRYYLLGWKGGEAMVEASLWYSDSDHPEGDELFVWKKPYLDEQTAIANVIANLLSQMKYPVGTR